MSTLHFLVAFIIIYIAYNLIVFILKGWLSLWFKYRVADPESYITMSSIGDAHSWRELIYAISNIVLYIVLY